MKTKTTKSAPPKGRISVSAYLIVDDVEQELAFVKAVFDAEIGEQQRNADGRIWHGEARVGESTVMLGRASAELPASPCRLHVLVNDVDAVYRVALEHGADSVSEPKDQSHGMRDARITDPKGNTWWIARRIERLSNQEIARKLAAQRRERL